MVLLVIFNWSLMLVVYGVLLIQILLDAAQRGAFLRRKCADFVVRLAWNFKTNLFN